MTKKGKNKKGGSSEPKQSQSSAEPSQQQPTSSDTQQQHQTTQPANPRQQQPAQARGKPRPSSEQAPYPAQQQQQQPAQGRGCGRGRSSSAQVPQPEQQQPTQVWGKQNIPAPFPVQQQPTQAWGKQNIPAPYPVQQQQPTHGHGQQQQQPTQDYRQEQQQHTQGHRQQQQQQHPQGRGRGRPSSAQAPAQQQQPMQGHGRGRPSSSQAPVQQQQPTQAWGKQNIPAPFPAQQQQPVQAWGKQNIPAAIPAQQQPTQNIPQESSIQATSPVVASTPDPAIEAISTSTSQMTLSPSSSIISLPVRKDLSKAGTQGRPFMVGTNMMRIEFGKRFPSQIYHYDVDIQPIKKKYLFRKVFFAALRALFPNQQLDMPFDGKKNAYSSRKLPINANQCSTKVIIADDDKRECEYTVTIKIANELDSSWLKTVNVGLQMNENKLACIQALNIILNSVVAASTCQIGRSFFTPPRGTATNLGGGMDLWLGLFQSAIIGWKPFLNVDVLHKGVFREQSLIDLIQGICAEGQRRGPRDPPPQQQPLTMRDILDRRNYEKIVSTISNLRVSLKINGVKERSRQVVRGLTKDKTPAQDFFTDSDNKNISVLQYYMQKKNYRIQRPDLPCAILNKGAHVPLEICYIEPGQSSDDVDTTNLIREAATNTIIRKKKIMDIFQQAGHNNSRVTKDFDISINGRFEEVPARVLDAPTLYYAQNAPVKVTKGVWRTKFFKKSENMISAPSSWSILNLNSPNTKLPQLQNFVGLLLEEGRKVGMQIGHPKTPFMDIEWGRYQDVRKIENYFAQEKKNGVKFIFVIFPDRIKSTYATIKQVAELKVGIVTQCIKSFTFDRKIGIGDLATINNILQKVNAKLNGINHSFMTESSRPKCLEVPCMIVGADVTHPSPQLKDTIPSIAAVVASCDPNAQFQHKPEIRLQDSRLEIIADLENIMREHLKNFYRKTGHKPQRIIFYRDGVSEGQFKDVMIKEIQAIRRACKSLEKDGGYKPPITFLVVQKRHHTRLFPLRDKDSDDRNMNVKAGTVVDTIITHPSHIDFYLVSHASIQGTARPTKYRCLWDDSNMSEDEIEQLTYYLCHMFSRCARSVSYPAPTYYAHLAAFRARHLIHNCSIDLQNLEREQKDKLSLQADLLQTPMFFV